MKSRIKAYAKINLSLKITGIKDGFHTLDSVVVTVDLYDSVTVSPRKDDKINIVMRGIGEDVITNSNNNAYKAALLFKETFKTKGMDVKIVKNIPLAGGLGGSSADVAGVLNALKKAFKIDADVKPIADKLGSDSGYLLTGGFARITGRGEIVRPIDSNAEFWVLLVYSETGVNTADCFKKYDEMSCVNNDVDNDKLTDAITNCNITEIARCVNNDLSAPARELCLELDKNLKALKDLSPLCASVSGSGATCFALFETKELTLWAADKMAKQGYEVEVVKTVAPQKLA